MSTRAKAEQIVQEAGIPPDPEPEPEAETWEDLVPLGSKVELPAFPLATLPPYIADMVAGVAEEMQVPQDLPGALALAALSTAAGGRAEVEVRGQWREPLNVYVAVAMPPGSGKSPAFRAMMAPIFAAEAELRESAREKIAEALAAREAAIATAQDSLKKAKDIEERKVAIAAAQMAEQMPVPTVPRLTADDVVPEQAATIMADQGGRLAILSAEGTFLEVVLGRYSNGRPNLELVLKGHAGDRLQIDRRGREEYIERPALTIGIAIQPDLLKDLAAKRQMHGRGGMARFLFSLPPDFVGYRKITPDTVPHEVIHSYRETLKDLVIDMAEWEDPAVIPMTPAALKLHIEWRTEIEPRLRRGTGDLEGLREWASKLPGATARLAGLLHLAENPKRGPLSAISEETMGRAIELARYYVAHAMAAFGVMRSHPRLEDARAVLEWIKADASRTTFTRRQVHRAFQRLFETADDVDQVMTLLEDHGYVRLQPAPKGRGRKPVTYTAHPDVHAEGR
ncbi:YfjI family protein [Thermomonospora cellulosilytica]|uniref:DUF3987 domain-containing protein n=1 Tax=Thermomonospora cellulosilytica TaxID=1411118 RepID=A0A7W3MUF9_9ACTN|nr:YfjI family protein [Thermomonospora cellulosilytica]MBA9002032.1 hypothetical protein [Thermomonospora cellulosilytica]